MKGIKDYFTSPNKQVNEDSRNAIIDKTDSADCIQALVTTQDHAKKKRKKKKKRKHSDPAITDVAQLLTDNLKFSPNNIIQSKPISLKETPENKDVLHSIKSRNTQENKGSNATGSIIKECKLKVSNTSLQKIESNDSTKRESEENKSCKLNAFQFMMDKRNKSIGSNSPGKELDKELFQEAEENKEKLAARRHLFSNWSELKGGEKRKRLEQEKDEIINHKLNERTKRLKKLLKVESDGNERTKTSKRKRSRRISSSSEENEDFEAKASNTLKEKSSRTKKTEVLNERVEQKARKSSVEKKCNAHNTTGDSLPGETNYKSKIKFTKNGIKKKPSLTDNICDKSLKVENNKAKSEKTGNLLSFIKSNKDNTDSDQNQKKSKSTKHPKVEKLEEFDIKHQKDIESNSNSNESSQEYTPRTLRSWKLKIKLKNDYLNQMESAQKTPVNHLELLSSDDSDAVELSSDNADDKKLVNLSKKSVKIAPVFQKSVPKPKEDPAIVEARKQFLMSGIPSSLKKVIDRQNSVVDQQDVFPITTHVQQKCNSLFWNLPPSELKLLEDTPISLEKDLKCEKLTKSHLTKDINIDTVVKKVVNLKALLNKIKKENPDYPVNKSFRQIYNKISSPSVLIEENKIPEKRKKGKKKKDKICKQKEEIIFDDYSMWTEKYKPKTSDEIVGNSQAIKRLKKWLEDWKQFSQEIHSRRNKNNHSSESDFETTDCDSRDSSKLPGKIVILEGPCGTGKTMAVYAICNELGFNVIELNASNKRTGKRLLQELQEATQSHQVRKRESQTFQTFFQSQTIESKENEMSLLLIEDVDLVFEQDDGFINALLQLTSTTKRPIIATTTDYSSSFIQKFFGTYEFIHFLPLSSFSIATWLQIVFLVEGSYVSRNEIGSLLEFNKGDVRKTLLQLQFWVQSGGQMRRERNLIKIEDKRNSCDEHFGDDEPFDNEIDEKSSECDYFEHKNCISTFEILKMDQPFHIPYYLNLDLLWWNIPNILNIPNYSKRRLDNNPEGTPKAAANNDRNKEDVVSISKVFDSLSYVDVMFKSNCLGNNEGGVNVRDSLELCENFNCYNDSEFIHELTHYLVNGYIDIYGNKENKLDVALPDRTERRWKTRIQECENEFNEGLLLSTDRKSSALDYMPVLRNITRSECARAANNTKRGNRFRNYLKDLGVKCQDKIITNACRIFNSGCSI